LYFKAVVGKVISGHRPNYF